MESYSPVLWNFSFYYLNITFTQRLRICITHEAMKQQTFPSIYKFRQFHFTTRTVSSIRLERDRRDDIKSFSAPCSSDFCKLKKSFSMLFVAVISFLGQPSQRRYPTRWQQFTGGKIVFLLHKLFPREQRTKQFRIRIELLDIRPNGTGFDAAQSK